MFCKCNMIEKELLSRPIVEFSIGSQDFYTIQGKEIWWGPARTTLARLTISWNELLIRICSKEHQVVGITCLSKVGG